MASSHVRMRGRLPLPGMHDRRGTRRLPIESASRGRRGQHDSAARRAATAGAAVREGLQPIIGDQGPAAPIAVYAFPAMPLLAVAFAIPFAWGLG